MANIEQRTGRTAERWERRAKERRRRDWNLRRLDNVGDALAVEDPGRLLKRMQDAGMSVDEAVEAMTRQEDPSDDTPVNDFFLERIINDSELIGVEFLLRGAMLTRGVGRVVIKAPSGNVLGHGTGFLVTPRLLMTNNHVLGGAADAAHSTIQFNHIERRGRLGPVEEFTLRPERFFTTDAPLDFTIVAVDEQSTTGSRLNRPWAPLIAASGKALVGESINIIQHPAGRPQEATVRENRVVDVFDAFLHYSSDTERGSSGAPAFNDHWELAALHHSGVPDRDDDGNILLSDDSVWNGSPDLMPMIRWKANEGIRISSIVTRLRAATDEFAGRPRDHLDELLDAAPPPDREAGPVVPAPTLGPGGLPGRVDETGRVHWIVPLEVTATLGAPGEPVVTVEPSTPGTGAPDPTPTAPPPPPPADPTAVDTARRRLNRAGEYYDADTDTRAAGEYYAEVAPAGDGPRFFRDLSTLVRDTHTNRPGYRTARLEFLYPLVDLREPPDVRLESVYSGKGFDPIELITAELEIEAVRERMLNEFLAAEGAVGEEALLDFLETVESAAPFNCEHVVPQSWFGKREPMKGDLHHLFTCEPGCNSFRSNIPYHQFGPEEEVVRDDCGRRETAARQFEPVVGKGAVARATMYFLLRYPGMIGDEDRELGRERFEPVLLRWHRNHPVDLWERHRNAEIARIQGNRNPLIDHPEWADEIDFTLGFG